MDSLISFLGDQPTFKVIRGLLTSNRARHLRDLATQYGLSPAGVSDILRRLTDAGVLLEERQENRRCFRLNISEEERACLTQFFSLYEITFVKERAPTYSKGASARLVSMDEAYSFYRKVKKR
jgi:DNA-binding MarR family transcriptional regulator